MLILPRETIEREVLEQGINEELCKMVYQEHGFISTALFEEWCWDVFFPEIQRRREAIGYAGDAVLMMDGLTCHESNSFEDACLEHGVCIEILPTHSSDQFQPCDLGVFGAMKTNIARVRTMPGMSKQSRQIVKILGALQTTLLPPTVVHAFAQARIHARHSPEHRCLISVMDASTARCVRHLDGEAEGGFLRLTAISEKDAFALPKTRFVLFKIRCRLHSREHLRRKPNCHWAVSR
jgi:hypothetical protein